MKPVLALDLGTTSVRALVVTVDGAVPARASRPLSTRFPRPGWVEQDPDEMVDASIAVLREALERAGLRAAEVASLGIVTQRATCLAWSAEDGRALAPAIGWQDQRTAERTAELRALGIPINTLASCTKFAWWLENDDAIAKAAAAGTLRLGTPDAWLAERLSGGEACVTDAGNASCTALFDAQAGVFSAPLCELFGVPHEALPTPAPTSAITGCTPRALFGAEVPLGARAGDQQAAAFAQGVHSPGDAKFTLGTSAMLDVHTGDAPIELRDGAFPLPLWTLADGVTAFCVEGQVLTAGAAVDWAVGLGVADDAAGVDRAARSVDSSDGVLFVPALQGLGTPRMDADARGAFLGLTRGSGRAQLCRAVLEGVAHRCADVTEALDASTPLRVDGGLARSGFLVQSLADFAGAEVQRAAETETTALGAAFLAGLAAGVWDRPEACVAVTAAPDVFEPQGTRDERAERRQGWRDAVSRIAGDARA